MFLNKNSNYLKLFGFTFLLSIITYGYTLANPSLSIDSETPIGSDFALLLGRWGTNLIRYHVFNGHISYFTLLLGLFFISITAVEISKLLAFKGYYNYIFCALFVSFPQFSYQFIFNMQADIIPIGFFLAVISIKYFYRAIENFNNLKNKFYFLLSSLLMMTAIAMYQALILIPIILFLIFSLRETFNENFKFKSYIFTFSYFSLYMIISVVFYYISVKIFCPPVESGYLVSYLSGENPNMFLDAFYIWIDNLKGVWYYGEKTFFVVTFLGLFLLMKFAFLKSNFLIRFIIVILLFLIPFGFTFFIANGYHPPRIYITSSLVFSFIIVYCLSLLNNLKVSLITSSVLCLIHIYFITNLFLSNHKILNHDIELAKKIDFKIKNKYPEFDEKNDYVYFYGYLPYEHHNNLRIDKSEAFGGSHFSWDNGDNYRIINFFKCNDVAYYKMIDNIDLYTNIKDSINELPVWPKDESVKKINNVVVVKLGSEKGAKLFIE